MIQQLIAAYGSAAAAGPLYLIDLQGAGGVTQSGYTACTNGDVYASTPGYGWKSGSTPAGTFDRGAAGGCTDTAFFRDANYAYTGTSPFYMEFQFKVTAGSSIGVRVYGYDNSNSWGTMTVTGDGGSPASVTITQGTSGTGPASGTITLTDGDNDGVVTLRITPAGSTIAVCNGFDVAATVGSLPAART